MLINMYVIKKKKHYSNLLKKLLPLTLLYTRPRYNIKYLLKRTCNVIVFYGIEHNVTTVEYLTVEYL